MKRKIVLMIFVMIAMSSCLTKKLGKETKPAIYTLGGGFKPDKIIDYKKIPEKDGSLQLHIFLPDGFKKSDERPVIVMFFGGGWKGSNIKNFVTIQAP